MVAASARTPLADRVPRELVPNLQYRQQVLEQARESEELRAELMKACADDVGFWINLFGYGFDGRLSEIGFHGDRPFVTYQFQDEVLRTLRDSFGAYDLVWEKSRGQGATFLALFVATHALIFRPQRVKVLLVSYKEDAVDKAGDPDCLFWKIDFIISKLPDWMTPRIRRVGMQITNLDSGSTIVGAATIGDVGVGGRPTIIIFDEFGVHAYGDEMLKASRDATNSRWFISTHRGISKTFYRITKEPGWVKLRSHWSQHPVFASGMYRVESDGSHTILNDKLDPIIHRMMARHPRVPWNDDSVWPQDYDFEWEGAIKFRDTYTLRSPWFDMQCQRAGSRQEIAQELEIDPAGSGSPYFDHKIIEEAIARDCFEPLMVAEWDYDPFDIRPREKAIKRVNGELSLWCELDEAGDPQRKKYVAGVDIAAGTGASNSVITFAEWETGKKVAEYASNKVLPDQLAHIAVSLCYWFCDESGRPAQLAWERNGSPGHTFGRKVIDSGFRNIWYRRREKTRNQKRTHEPGFYSTAETKGELLSNYRRAIGQGKFTNPNRYAMLETLEYQEGGPGKGPVHPGSVNSSNPADAGDNHGDRVIADALANMLCSVVIDKPKKVEERERRSWASAPHGTLAHLLHIEEQQQRQGAGSEW